MCGIAGLFAPAAELAAESARRSLDAMSAAIVHRGPDADGTFFDSNVALAHRRLSIIDLATGQQPLYNEDGSVVVVYNGEIYNFGPLRAELQAKGHVFRTNTDSEVIVHGWEQWGADCVARFRGMFAFALWDRSRKTLFLARDRLGVKPLHYAFLRDGTIAFASELKCFKTLSNFERTLDDQAIEDYLALGYIPDPKTVYARAAKLPPATTLTWRVGQAAPRIRQYWNVKFEPRHDVDLADAAVELRAHLTEAVRIRMISDVPLGAFLSGGVDSGTVVGLMAGLSPKPVATCSVGFEDPAFDESEHARAVAELHRTDHRQSTVGTDDLSIASHVVRLYDEPFADSSALPTYRVCEMARRHVTVALSGDGGDETFGGYRRYRFHLVEERLRSFLPYGLRRTIFGPLGNLYPKFDVLPRPFRAKSTLQALARDSVNAYFQTVSLLRDDDRATLYTPSFRRRLSDYRALSVFVDHARHAPTDDPLSLIQYLDYKTYLPGDINTKVDRASMAHSLEVREPLMDHLLVEWVATLPSRFKIRDGVTKALLKEAAKPLLPALVLKRPKMGFAVPMASWFRGDSGRRLSNALLTGHAVQAGILDRDRLEQLCRQHQTGERAWGSALWSIYCLNEFLAGESGDRATAVPAERGRISA